MKKAYEKNALLMIPEKDPKVCWDKKEKIITLIIKRNKRRDKIMNKIFKTPTTIKIDLDELGSFVWENCDGKSNVNDIANKLKDQFGEKAEPIMERLITYIKILLSNKFISIH